MTDMVLIAKDDSAVGFHTRICNAGNLETAVFLTMFGVPEDTENREEVAEIAATLLAAGSMDFEDGWIGLCQSLPAAVLFFMEKLTEARDEQRYSDEQRFEELKARRGAEENYTLLRDALKQAIGNGAKAANLRYVMENPK